MKHLQFTVLALLIIAITSCSKDDPEANGALAVFGIDDQELLTRLTTSMVGQVPDAGGDPPTTCANGVMQLMEDDPLCGYVDVAEYVTNRINMYRAKHNLQPYVRAIEHELCAAREAKLAAENGAHHWNAGCGWRAQGSSGGPRGDSDVEGSVTKAIKLFYGEGPDGGHYRGMMRKKVRGVAVGYYAIDRDHSKLMVNYYDKL